MATTTSGASVQLNNDVQLNGRRSTAKNRPERRVTPHQPPPAELQCPPAPLIHRGGDSYGGHRVTSAPRALSPSQRALGRAGGNAIPVSPERAVRTTSAARADRTASLPRSQQVTSPAFCQATEMERSQSALNGTTRTVELIERFPLPPESSGQATQTAVQRPQVWSLFPKPSTPTQRRSFSNLLSWSGGPQTPTVTPRKLQKRLRSNAITSLDGRLAEADVHTGEQAAVLPDGRGDTQAHIDRPGTTAIEDAAEDRDLPSVRGEGSTRYRQSGTPVYELDAASLRSRDERVEQAQADLDGLRAPAPSRVASSQTGTSRYFSAASKTLPSPVVAAQVFPWQAQQQSSTLPGSGVQAHTDDPLLSVAGQRRYVDQARAELTTTAVNQSAPDAQSHVERERPAERTQENAFPITGVTITSHGALCPHGKPIKTAGVKSSSNNMATINRTNSIPLYRISNLDGEDTNSPPPISSQVQNLEPSAPTRTATFASPPDQQPPTTVTPITLAPPLELSLLRPTTSPHGTLSTHGTFHPAHLRNVGRAKGTWRTRMSRTKCWRCELHNCKKKGWARFERMMEWTCFCQFRAYEHDSSSEEGMAMGSA
ncbi:hypothetical protein LTR85_007345 [Meristemomyces frigidus]|nr:hypothetical protein LTR85_007345 [Meristemomyces frigidus]